MPRATPSLVVAISLIGVLVMVMVDTTNPQESDSSTDLPTPAGSGANAAADGDSTRHDAIAHGEYLVHQVAMCVQCHSPRGADGELDKLRLLDGAPIPLSSPFPEHRWAFRAPSLRGLPGGWSESQLSHFLQTGEPPTEYSILPPMPPFRLNEADAQAIAAYLASLTP